MLRESLVDYSELEIPSASTTLSSIAAAKIDNEVENLCHQLKTETADEREARLARQTRNDKRTLAAYTCVAVSAIASGVVAMAASTLGALETAFAIPFLTGPYTIRQREKLIKGRKKKELIASIQLEAERISTLNDELRKDVDSIQLEVSRLHSVEDHLRTVVERQGHDLSVFRALYRENQKINKAKKRIAEAIALETLITSVMSTDLNEDHYIGDSELNLLAFRLEAIEGVPFTGEELCDRFGRMKNRSLGSLVNVVRNLYVERRRDQFRMKTDEDDKSPKNLGSHLLLKRKIEYGGPTIS